MRTLGSTRTGSIVTDLNYFPAQSSSEGTSQYRNAPATPLQSLRFPTPQWVEASKELERQDGQEASYPTPAPSQNRAASGEVLGTASPTGRILPCDSEEASRNPSHSEVC